MSRFFRGHLPLQPPDAAAFDATFYDDSHALLRKTPSTSGE
ncbi:MAG: hypothetical protein WD648_13410 [Planctomycetaceae bacterium]